MAQQANQFKCSRQETPESDGPKVAKPMTLTDIAMTYFFEKPSNQKEAASKKMKIKCKKCSQEVTVQASNFQNFVNHAKKVHKGLWKELADGNELPNLQDTTENQLSIKEGFQKQQHTNLEEKDTDIIQKLVQWIVLDDQPFRVVSVESFRRFCACMYTRSTKIIPKSPHTIRKRVIDLYQENRVRYIMYISNICKFNVDRIQNVLGSINHKLSATTDIWTAPNQDSFMAITVHWIDDSWKLHNILLDFVSVPGIHTGERLAQEFTEVLELWNLRYKILGITLDSASNNAKMTDYLEESGILDIGNHHKCFAHALNLACKEAIKCFDDKIRPLRNIVKKIRYSSKRISQLKAFYHENIQKKDNRDEECDEMVDIFLKPTLDVETRWNSTYDMIERACKIKSYLTPLSEQLDQERSRNTATEVLTDASWKIFLELCKFLKPFKAATIQSNAELTATMSYVIPMYNTLLNILETHTKNYKKKLVKVENLDHELKQAKTTATRKETIRDELKGLLSSEMYQDLLNASEMAFEKLKNYFDTSQDACDVATILDPRLKLEYFGHDEIEESEKQQKMAQAKATLVEHLNVFSTYTGYQSDSSATSDKSSSSMASQKSLELIPTIFSQKKKNNSRDKQLQDYLNSHGITDKKDPNAALSWWKIKEDCFPLIAHLAKQYLAIPATSTPCERIFSTGKQIMGPNRHNLNPETFRMLICLRSWINSGL